MLEWCSGSGQWRNRAHELAKMDSQILQTAQDSSVRCIHNDFQQLTLKAWNSWLLGDHDFSRPFNLIDMSQVSY